MDLKNEKSIYNLLRGFTILLAGFYIFGAILQLIKPSLIYSYAPFPSRLEIFVDVLPELIFLIVLFIPHRLSLSKWIFYPKLFILVIGGGWFVYIGFTGVYRYFHFSGLHHWLIIPSSFIFYISFGISAPLTLYMKKRLSNDSK